MAVKAVSPNYTKSIYWALDTIRLDTNLGAAVEDCSTLRDVRAGLADMVEP